MQLFKRWSPFILLVCILAILLVPKLVLTSQSAASPAGPPQRSAQPVKVEVVKAEPFAQTRKFSGTLRAFDGVDIQPETSGKVVRIAFEEGAMVKEGDLLVKLKDDELRAQLRAARHSLELARLQANRQMRLLQSGSTTQEAFDEARIRQSTLEAELALIDARLDKTEIRAPFSGSIGLRQVSPGAVVNSNTVITTLQQIDNLKVDFSVPERHLTSLRIGKPVSLQVDGQDTVFSGEIIAINPKIDIATRTLTCRALVRNDQRRLLPGGFAQVSIDLQTVDEAILIPSTAVIPDLETQTVFLAMEGKAISRKITTGARTNDRVLVTSGLQPGDKVITVGVQSLRPQSPIRVVKDES